MQKLIAQSTPSHLIKKLSIGDTKLNIYENEQYRWFTYTDDAIQGVIDKYHPERVVLPVNQAMLLFLQSPKKMANILNLGLGSAAIERALTYLKDYSLCSVELNEHIVSITRQHFQLPDHQAVILSEAQQYLATNQAVFDVALIDLFSGGQPASCLFDEFFWQDIKRSLSDHGQAFVNIYLKDNNALKSYLILLKRYFKYLVIVEFVNHKNLIIGLSQTPLGFITHSGIKSHQELRAVTDNLSDEIKGIFHY